MGWWALAMVSWLAGTGLGLGWPLGLGVVWSGAAACAGLGLVGMALRWRLRPAWRWAWLGLGLLAWAGTHVRVGERAQQQVPDAWLHRPVALRGQVMGLVRTGPGWVQFDARVEAWRPQNEWISADDARASTWPRCIAVRLRGAPVGQDGRAMLLRPGAHWSGALKLHAPDGLSNPGVHDSEWAYWLRGARAVGQGELGQVVASGQLGWQGWVDRWRSAVLARIQARVQDAQSAGVVAGLSVGDQSAVDQQDWNVFRRTGVAHLVSISGTHVVMLGWLAAWCLRRLWPWCGRWAWRWPAPDVARVGALGVSLLYAVLSGWGVPAQRTVIMMALFVWLRLHGRRWPGGMVWLAAATVVSAWDPWALVQPGFWLSFVAVGVLMSMMPNASSGAFTQGVGWRAWLASVWHAAVDLGRTQWRVSIALAPLSLVFFQQMSVVGLLANLWAIPVFTLVITPLAVLGMWLPFCWDGAAWVIHAAMVGLGAMAQPAWAVWDQPLWPGWLAPIMVAVGASLLWPMSPRWRLISCVFLLPLLYLPHRWQWGAPPPPGQFAVVAADVGQGSAILVRTAHHTLLFDTGAKMGSQWDAGQHVLLPLMRAIGVRQLDALVISHADNDHIGGAESIVQAMPVGQLWSTLEPEHPLREHASAMKRPVAQRACVAGQSWLWDGVLFKVIYPTARELADRAHLSDNALSCVIQVAAGGAQGALRTGAALAAAPMSAATEYGRAGHGRVALLTGDIEAPQEASLVARHEAGEVDLRSDLLLVPHHGSQTSSTRPFLQAVQPAQSVIQVGRRNRYGHPAPSVLARYQALGLKWVASPDCGAYFWRSDQAHQDAAPSGCWRAGRGAARMALIRAGG